jgi:hypothetical protein
MADLAPPSLSRRLAAACVAGTLPLHKADIPAGAHWITAHPNGPGTKGQPLLIEPHPDGTAHVIGGAGGKLNYLKLRGVKSPEEYKADAAKKAAELRHGRKLQIERDKELGLHDAKRAARESINLQRKAAEKEFINAVSKAMGWDKGAGKVDVNFPEVDPDSKLTPEALKKAESKRHTALLRQARAAVTLNKRRLLADADARAASGLGVLPLDAPDSELSVSDLDPVRRSGSTGVSQDFKGRAERAGLTKEKLDAEVGEIRDAELGDKAEEARLASIRRGELAAKVRDELAASKADQTPDLEARLVDAKEAVDLLRAEKKLRAIQSQARAANKAVAASHVEPKAFVVTADLPDADAVAAELVDDLRTAGSRAFLLEAGKVGDAIEPHLATGAFNAMNALSLAAGGASLIDRSVVDVLGVAGAAQVLARRLRADLGADAEHVAGALEDFHVSHYPELSGAALEQVKELHARASEIEAGVSELAKDGGDVLALAELNQRRADALGDAQKVLGHALGEMEANAAIVMAFKGQTDKLQVSLGTTPLASAVQQVHALGLEKGDYDLERSGGNVFLSVKASGLDRLAQSVDHENLARVGRNLSIMRGDQDEDGWLPDGFARRPDLGLDLAPGVAESMAIPFDGAAADLGASLRDYIGSRTADGDRAADILADIQSSDFFAKAGAGRSAEYRAALDAVAPNKIDGKSLRRAEDLDGLFNGYADEFVGSRFGGERSTLNRQTLDAGAVSQEALHRALAAEPAGTVAYKPIGELTPQDQRAMRDYFGKHIAKEDPEQAALRESVEKLDAAQPERFTTDMFGEQAESPEWSAWKSARDEAAGKLSAAGLDWPGYVKMMRSPEKAYEAVQDVIRSSVSKGFADHYNRLNPGAPLAVGRTVVRNNLNHLDAIDPEARAAREAKEREMIDALRNRHEGKYAAGSVADKLDAAKEQKAAFEQAQMGFFASDDLFGGGEEKADKPLAADERHTIGHAAEQRLAALMGVVGPQFKPGQPVKLFNPSMSGKDGAPRQRAIKLLAENKRVALGMGVGSGKTGVMLGGFAHLHSAGKVKKGIFMVPSIVQGQFGAEALRFLNPGQFKWHAEPGASFEDRMAAYKDPGTHFSVVTHQSFRDDLLRMAVMRDGGTPEEVADKMGAMSGAQRSEFMRGVLDHHGIAFDFAAADEAHGFLDRAGKEDSRLSHVTQAVTDGAEYYAHASGDPVKNDASEAFSLLNKMDPARYTDRDAFMRRYGGDTQAAGAALRRELARHLYAASINPDVAVSREQRTVAPSPEQASALADLDGSIAKLRVSRISGKADVPAARALMPDAFDGVPPEQHEAVALELAKTAGIVRDTAVRRILDTHEHGAKAAEVLKIAGERKGQQGVVFARSLAAVEQLRAKLEAAGHKVVTITGKDSSVDKASKIRAFNPDSGDASADIVVCSDAGATGANLQSGRWLLQYDTPDTAMTHAQRQGRIARVGQKNAVELIDLVSDHESDRRARDRLSKKYGLRDLVTSPLESMDDSGFAHFLAQRRSAAQGAQGGLF